LVNGERCDPNRLLLSTDGSNVDDVSGSRRRKDEDGWGI
jgi:hypothetical protein